MVGPAIGFRRRFLCFIVLLVSLAAPAVDAQTDPMDPNYCSYPLGPAAENGRFSLLSSAEDPELGTVDASFSGATKTQVSVVSLWGTLHAVYDGRWRIGDGQNGSQGGSRHNIQVKSFDAVKGWNVSTEYASNPDTTNVTPIGNALNPRAVAYKDALWIVFVRESAANFEANGSHIMLRSKSADGSWGPFIRVNDPNWTAVQQYPDLLVVNDKLLVAWTTMQGATHSLDPSLKGRFFDGTTFGPLMNISTPNDGFGEGYFTLATDGQRVAAAWISQNATSVFPSYVPKFAVFDGTQWSREVDLWSENAAVSYDAAVEFYQGALYLVFDTNDPRLSRQGDYDVFMRVADPLTLEVSEGVDLVSNSNNGDDYQPELEVFNGRLFLTWVSDDEPLTHGNDFDLILMTRNSTGWSAPENVLADEKWNDDAQRAEFTALGDALVLNWIELVKPPGSTTKDQRVVLRIIERGERWWDGLNATYAFEGDPAGAVKATVTINFTGRDGTPVASPWYSLRDLNGQWMRLEGNESGFTVEVAYNETALQPFDVYVCGKPVSLTEAPSPPPAEPKPSPVDEVVIPALVLAAVVAALGRRSLKRQ